MDTTGRLDKLTKAVTAIYADDPSAPSVLMAWVESKQVFYGSIVRYRERFGGGKQVVIKADGSSTDEVIDKLCTALEDVYGRDKLDAADGGGHQGQRDGEGDDRQVQPGPGPDAGGAAGA